MMLLVKCSMKYCSSDIGKIALMNFASKFLVKKFVKELVVHTELGQRFALSFPEDVGYESIYFYNSYETGTTDTLKRLIKSDDIVFDIGANIGWYTTLFAKIIGAGQCHAFEPVPKIFEKLKKNCLLTECKENVIINNLALGDLNQKVQLHTFSGLPHGHSSIKSFNRRDSVISETRMITLDEYVAERQLRKVDLIKVDVEGAELKVLEGASKLFSTDTPPMWLFEMNQETSSAFGYHPGDILDMLKKKSDYEFYRIKGAWGRLEYLNSTSDCQNGDNVLCVTSKHIKERLAALKELAIR
jgi:FkbM family methyltransferase